MTRFGNRSLRRACAGGLLTSALVALVAVALYSANAPTLNQTVTTALVSVCLVCSLQLFVGNSGILSFGHVAFMGIGAYVTALVTIPHGALTLQVPDLPATMSNLELGVLPAAALSGLICALVGAVVGLVFVSMREDAMVMATLALLVIVYTVLLNWTQITRGSQGLFAIPQAVTPVWAIVAAVVFVCFTRVYKGSQWGLRLRATREDPLSAASAGINVARVRFGAWVLSAALTGTSGSLWAMTVIAFGPGQFFFAMTFSLLAMLVVGGRESVAGAVVGVALVTVVTEVLARVEKGVSIGSFELPRMAGSVQLAVALIIIITLIRRPQGLVGRREIDELPTMRRRTPSGGSRVSTTPASMAGSPPMASGVPGDIETGEVVLRAGDIGKQFNGLVALDGVDIEVRAGEILGLIGPNGSGKTTLLNVLSGITRPDSGSFQILGRDALGVPPQKISRRGLTRTFQNIRLLDHLTVQENVQSAARGADATDERVATLLESMGLSDLADQYADSLPYGLQRRLEIARALAARPRVLLLDEPAAGMNEGESDALLRDINTLRDAYQCGIIVVDHDLRLIMRLCDRIQVLEQGRTLAVGLPEDVAHDPAVISAYLGTAAADPAGSGITEG